LRKINCFFLAIITILTRQSVAIISSLASSRFPTGLDERVCSKITGYTLTLSTMPKKAMTAEQPASFEEAMAELEELVAGMESGELPLEASVAAYKRGSELVKYCTAQLDKVENQVKVLEGDMLKPFSSDAGEEADE
jgi:exodeoxyribonuclease VII small subunit